ncbi:uncharacterized protein si:ch211-127m7.2 [Xiphias gladius]|uniref:uncharacterized protein si:ch211-127m7.2 n=1 Tax=Xiphias gladius TaxID=8245 RepID=UPI001A984382|nr:uncharacterized protein si:ch211-127m7.2 [Xiphias gladius]
MSERHRALPPWMAEARAEEKEPLGSRRKRKAARAAFYCMNEKELVEAAVSYLTTGACQDVALLTDHKVEDEAGGTTVKKPASSKTKAKPVTEALEEESSDCSDAQETTYVSETDLDITEAETVPYAEKQQRQGPEGQRSGPTELEAEKREECSQTLSDAAEDDALRLVREIFFT